MDDEYDEVIAEFLIESYENLDRLVQDLLALEENPSEATALASAFRTVHTIKGTCGFLGYSHLERVTHVGENLLSLLRDGELELDAAITTGLLAMVDAVRDMLAAIESTRTDGDEAYDDLVATLGGFADRQLVGATASAPSRNGDAPALVGEILVDQGATGPDEVALALAEQGLGDDRPLGEILVDHGAVDEDDVDQAVLEQAALEQAVLEQAVLEQVRPTPAGTAAAGAGTGDSRPSLSDSTIRVDVNVLDQLMNLVGELVLGRNNIVQHVGVSPEPALLAASQQLDLVTGELQECVMKTRMQPIGTVWSKFTRVVRDLAVQCGKQVRIEMDGEETELDKTILEAVKDPLTHIIRNTVDHGIESPAERLAAGKPADGVLRLRAFHEGGQVIIEIADDGAGIDTAKVRAKAVARGLLTGAQAEVMNEHDAVQLIFAPGFSTADAVTNVSGRGVGMDVVKTNIERIGGAVDVETRLGEGTTLRIKIPLTLAIVPALMVDCAGQRFAIPQIEVQELVRLGGDHVGEAIEMMHNAPVHRLRGNLLPLVDLREQLGMEPLPAEHARTIAVVSTDNRPWGLVVDGVTTTEEIVVKPLRSMLRSVHAFSGATIMGDGRISLILDIARIGRRSNVVATAEAMRHQEGGTAETAPANRAKVLVVTRDDVPMGIDLTKVERLEQFSAADIERSNGLEVIQYRGTVLPLVSLGYGEASDRRPTIVFDCGAGLVGLVVERIEDIVEADLAADSDRPPGTIVVRDRVTEMVDIDETLAPAVSWFHRNLTGVGA